jgi:hypothetical protein
MNLRRLTTWKGIVWTTAAVLIAVAFVYTMTLGAFGLLAAGILLLALILDPLGMGIYDRIRNAFGGGGA